MKAILRAAWAVFARELRLALRRPAEGAQPLVFYCVLALLFPLGLAAQDSALRAFAPAIVWVSALLAALLGIERLFRSDVDDGTLELWLLADVPTALLVAAKLAAQWLLIAAPLIVVAPIIALALNLEAHAVRILVLSLLLGTPVLIFTGGFAAALTVGAPRAGLLIPILVLPLMCPALIFGAGAVRAAQAGLAVEGPLYFLAAMMVMALTLLPWATAGALRNALE
ncbi:MAG: ccmB [Nevskia sp.]|nr:ccmB [Nevskia sp.]